MVTKVLRLAKKFPVASGVPKRPIFAAATANTSRLLGDVPAMVAGGAAKTLLTKATAAGLSLPVVGSVTAFSAEGILVTPVVGTVPSAGASLVCASSAGVACPLPYVLLSVKAAVVSSRSL